MYVMHNPVMWTDPSGLFAWNEADDHWFDLYYEVAKAGGSMTGSGRRAAVSIWGVSVSFISGSSGVEMRDGRMHVRADTFYSAIVGEAQEIMFLGGHPAMDRAPAAHMNISMFMSSGRYNHLTRSGAPRYLAYFSDNIRWGSVRYAHISGGATNENWQAAIPFVTTAISTANREAYLDRSGLMFLNHLYTGTGMVTQLFAAHHHFMDNHSARFRYTIIPGNVGFNSTSVTVSLLSSVGLCHGLSDQRFVQHLGSHRTIAPRHFGN